MDRLERIMELVITDHVKFADEHNKLLMSQVLLTDRMDGLAISLQELAESQKHTDKRMGGLIQMMDTFVPRTRRDQKKLEKMNQGRQRISSLPASGRSKMSLRVRSNTTGTNLPS